MERAHAERADFQLLLRRYVLERLLYRLSISPYRDRFILKGALLLSVWSGDRFRPTRDLDLLAFGDINPERMAKVFREICSQPGLDDGVIFDAERLNAEAIREQAEYGGIRVRTTARISEAQVPVQVDVGGGDAITPGPVPIEYPTLLDYPAPHLQAYTVETVVAEKFEPLAVLGMANSRLKDYHDLVLISRICNFELDALSEAVHRTFNRRGTLLPETMPSGLTEDFAVRCQARWLGFIGRDRIQVVGNELAGVIADLRRFLLPVIERSDKKLKWVPGGPWSK